MKSRLSLKELSTMTNTKSPILAWKMPLHKNVVIYHKFPPWTLTRWIKLYAVHSAMPTLQPSTDPNLINLKKSQGTLTISKVTNTYPKLNMKRAAILMPKTVKFFKSRVSKLTRSQINLYELLLATQKILAKTRSNEAKTRSNVQVGTDPFRNWLKRNKLSFIKRVV